MKTKFIITCVAMLICLTACNKDNSKPTPEPEPTTSDMMFVLLAFDNQFTAIDHSFALDVNGKSATVTSSQMKEITNDSKYADVVKAIKSGVRILSLKEYKIYAYELGNFKAGQSVKVLSQTYTPAATASKLTSVDVLEACGLYSSYCNVVSIPFTAFYEGVNPGNDLMEFCKLLSKTLDISYTVPVK